MIVRCQQENRHLKDELGQLKERLTSLTQEYEVSSDSRVRGLEQIDMLKRQVSALQLERDATSRDKTKQVSYLTQQADSPNHA